METVKNIKEIKEVKPEQPKTKELKDVSTLELESLAFRIGEQVKEFQRRYNEVYNELVRRQQKPTNVPITPKKQAEAKKDGNN